MGPRLHPRHEIVTRAGIEFAEFMHALVGKYDLTYGEEARILSERLSQCAMFMIRVERHPDNPSKKGDEL